MDNDNLSSLMQTMKVIGFGDSLLLLGQLADAMEQGVSRFQLTVETSFDEFSNTQVILYFDACRLLKFKTLIFYDEYPDLNRHQMFLVRPTGTVTFKESFNLLQGRAVAKALVNARGEEYEGWMQLNFDDQDESGNYKIRRFSIDYGYDIERILQVYPIEELQSAALKSSLIQSLKVGNLHPVTFVRQHKRQKMFIEACPQSRMIAIYTQAVLSLKKPRPIKIRWPKP